MRLGAYTSILKEGSLAAKIYGKTEISERHRHRYEFNNDYRKQLTDKDFVISATSPDDFFVEMIELPTDIHPFFLATKLIQRPSRAHFPSPSLYGIFDRSLAP
jgi:CTP synthase